MIFPPPFQHRISKVQSSSRFSPASCSSPQPLTSGACSLQPEPIADTVQLRFGKAQASDFETQAWQFVKKWDQNAEACLSPYSEAEHRLYRQQTDASTQAFQQAQKRVRQTFSSPEAYQAHQEVKNLLRHSAQITDLVLRKSLQELELHFRMFQDGGDETGRAEERVLAEESRLIRASRNTRRSPAYAERYKQLICAKNDMAGLMLPGHSNWLDLGLQDLGIKPAEAKRLLKAMEPVLEEWDEFAELINLKELLLNDGTRMLQPFIDPVSRRPLTFAQLMQSDDPEYLGAVLDTAGRFIQKIESSDAAYISRGQEQAYASPHKEAHWIPTRVSLRQILRKTAERWGFPAVENVLNNPNSFLMEEKNRMQPVCTPINAPSNVCADTYIGDGQAVPWPVDVYTVNPLHEVVGHGGGFTSINPDLPFLLRHHNQVSAEGLGFMTELLLSTDPVWQKAVLGMNDATIQRVKPAAAKLRWQALRDSLTKSYGKARFAQRLYEQPNLDLEQLSAETLQGGRTWKEDVTFMTYPQRYIVYTMAHLWMAQVADYLENRFGGVYTKAAGQYLRAHFAQGKVYDWQESAEDLTGKSLSVEPLRRMIRQQYADVVRELTKMGPPSEH